MTCLWGRGGLDSVSSHSNNQNFQGKKLNPTLMSALRAKLCGDSISFHASSKVVAKIHYFDKNIPIANQHMTKYM